ncbi:MAG: Ig-like domain-containing protein [Gammaproteobacteria bacterium]
MLAMVACGGGGDDSKFETPPSGGGGTTTGAPAAVTVTTSAATLPSDGTANATITAYVRDANNALLKDVAVTFGASSGGMAPASATTDASGAATTTVSLAGDASLRTIAVTASVGALQAATSVQVIAPGGGGGGTTGTATSLSVTTDTATIPTTGSASIKAYVRDASNALISGVPVTFSATSGGVAPASVTSDANGVAATSLNTAGDPALRTITVTARTGNLTASVNVAVVTTTGGTTGTVSTLTLATSRPTIPSDGSANATITAYVRNASNALISGVPVTFTASSGGVTPASASSDASGAAATVLSTAGDTALRTVTITASAGGLTATTNVQVVSSSSNSSVQMGKGTGTAFQAGVLEVSNPTLSAGGSSSISAYLVNSDGTLYTQAATITFNSPCVASGKAAIQPSANASTTTGIATVTYVAKGCAGNDPISATATVNGQALSSSSQVSVVAAAVGSIVFVSATPTNIALQGTGDVLRPESSTVVFRVADATNGPVAGAAVAFALNTSIGGITLTPATAVSDAQGLVQTVVSGGTVATSVKVTAAVTSTTPTISTQSSQLTVTTGIPTAASFSLAVQCFNIEGWEVDGVTTELTARLGDRFQNPVPDGTAVTLTAEGGNIQSQCTTGTTPTEGGVCKVNFRSSEPRPSNGRVTILAKAIGEESFVDANGNGAFDNGETFTDQSEPFRDDNENGNYEPGEDFFDFNNNQTRDGPDGLFNGVLCKDTSGRCGAASTRSTGIGRSARVIMSGSTPTIAVSGVTSMTANSAIALSFTVLDVNGNIMPGGTTVALSASGSGLSVAAPGSFAVPCALPAVNASIAGQTVFGFTVNSGTTLGTGVATLTVTTPRGTVTTAQVNITVLH